MTLEPCPPIETFSDDDYPRTRPSADPDPNDPEPIGSTGSNKWDLITDRDPSAFVRLENQGPGTAELLPPDKDGAYLLVDGVYLYRAYFDDDTDIEIRIHPDIGTQADADAEAQRYLDPLGRLPTVLRRDIEFVAVQEGDHTAQGSHGEGINLWRSNVDTRLADHRLEETLFHEAGHTSLDCHFSYQRSPEWMEAQAADGRFISEYARENPDTEDLAETALYAYALQHYPERFPDGVADELRERVPNRLRFIETDIFNTGTE